jgi:putative membrane protein
LPLPIEVITIANEHGVNLKGGLLMLVSEWKYLLKHRMMLVVLLMIALIPAIYCFIYLSSMWNTYGKMANLPVAIVDHDKAIDYQQRHLAIGRNLTTNLVKSQSLNFKHVSATKAKAGLKSGKYYMVLTIPTNFSKDATTILSAQPKTMALYFKFNSGQNFIVSKMTSGVATAIKAKVSAQVTTLYSQIVLKGLGAAKNGMAQAAAGGAALTTGSQNLLAGESQLHSGTTALSSGLNQVKAGNDKLLQGNQTLTNGLAKLTSRTPQLTAGQTQLQNSLAKLVQATPPSSAANLSKLLAGSQQLTTGFATYAQGVTSLANGNANLGQGLQTLAANLPTLQTGSAQLVAGSQTLTQGTQRLLTGSQTLTTGLTAGVQKLQVLHTAPINATTMAQPVKAHTSDIAKVPNNGTGMAPFAIAIGLYVGGIAIGTMYDAFLPHKKPKYALTWWGSKAAVVGLVGVLQAVLLFWSLTQGNHLQVNQPQQLFLVILLGSWLFLSLIFALRLLLGGFGTWLISIVLVLQLAASGGLYPTFLVNHFAQSLNTWLPMTYLINALRSVISTHQVIQGDIWLMVLIMIGLNLAIILRFQLSLHRFAEFAS